MPIARFQMADGRIGRFEVPEGTTPEQAQKMIGDSLSLKEEEPKKKLPSADWQKKFDTTLTTQEKIASAADVGISAVGDLASRAVPRYLRPFLPSRETLLNLGAGGTQLTRNLLGIGKVGESVVDKESGAYQLGQLAAPETIALFGGAMKAAPVVSQAAARYIPKLGYLGKYGQGVAAGTAGGAVVGGLSDEGDAGTGAAIGGIVSAALPPVISGIAKSVGWIADAAQRHLPKIHAAKYLRDTAGKNLPEMQQALRTAPEGETAAQATYGIDNDVWQALGEMAKRHDKEAIYRVMADKQKMMELSQIAKKARGMSPEESIESQKWMKTRLEMALKPVREGELRKADFAGKVIPEAERRTETAIGGRAINPNTGEAYIHPATGEPVYTGRAGAVQNAGQLYSEFGNQTNQAWKTAERQLGAIGDVKVARHTEQGLKNYGASQEFVDIAKNLSNEIKFNEKVVSAIDTAGLKPLNLAPTISRIDNMLASKTTRMSDAEVKVLGALKDKLAVVNEGGVPDAFALYELRKKGINEIIDALEGSGQLTKKSAEGALLKLRPMIDKALEDAGATQWGKGYLNKYSKGIDAINRVKVADALRTLYDENPQKYIDVVRGKEPKFIEDLVPNQKGFRDLFSESTTKKFENLAWKAERKIKMSERAKGAETALVDVLKKDAWRFRLPQFVDKFFAAGNKALNVLENIIDRKTMAEVVKGMQSGKNAAELMNVIPISQRRNVMTVILNAQKTAPYVGMLGAEREQQ